MEEEIADSRMFLNNNKNAFEERGQKEESIKKKDFCSASES